MRFARVSQLPPSADCLACVSGVCLFCSAGNQALLVFPTSESTSALKLQHLATISSARAVNLDATILQ